MEARVSDWILLAVVPVMRDKIQVIQRASSVYIGVTSLTEFDRAVFKFVKDDNLIIDLPKWSISPKSSLVVSIRSNEWPFLEHLNNQI